MLGNPRDFPVSIKSPKHPKSIVLGATISRFHLPSSSLTQMWNSRHVWITVDQFSERGQSLIVFPYGEHLLNVYSSPQRDVTRIIDHQFHPKSSKFYLNLVVWPCLIPRFLDHLGDPLGRSPKRVATSRSSSKRRSRAGWVAWGLAWRRTRWRASPVVPCDACRTRPGAFPRPPSWVAWRPMLVGIFGEVFRGEFLENVGITIFWTGRYFFLHTHTHIYIYVFWGYSEIPWSFVLNVYMFDYLGKQFVGKRGTDAQMNEILVDNDYSIRMYQI